MFHSGLSEGSLPAPTIPSEVSTTAAMETETTSTADEMQKTEGIVETEATLTVDVEQEKEEETEETTERAIENDPIVKIDPDQEISAQEDQHNGRLQQPEPTNTRFPDPLVPTMNMSCLAKFVFQFV